MGYAPSTIARLYKEAEESIPPAERSAKVKRCRTAADRYYADLGPDCVFRPDPEGCTFVVNELTEAAVKEKAGKKKEGMFQQAFFVYLCRATGNRPANLGRLFYGNVHFDERDDLEVRWKSRTSQSKRAQRATATYLSAWSMPCPAPLRTWAQPLIDADLKVVAGKKTTTVEGKSILPDEWKVSTAARKVSEFTKLYLGSDITSGVFRDTIDPILRRELCNDPLRFKACTDHTLTTARAFYTAGWEAEVEAEDELGDREDFIDEADEIDCEQKLAASVTAPPPARVKRDREVASVEEVSSSDDSD